MAEIFLRRCIDNGKVTPKVQMEDPARELESGTAELGEVGAGSGEWAGACPGSDSCTAAAL